MITGSAVRDAASRYAHVITLVAILGATVLLFPKSAPLGIYGLGAVSGIALAFNVIGVLLIYRSNRVINFAQVQVGVVTGIFFASMVQLQPLLRFVEGACLSCSIGPAMTTANYILAAVLSLILAGILGYGVYFVTVRRLGDAPRMILTVATIFVAQLLAGLGSALPRFMASEEQREAGLALGPSPLPFDFSFRIAPVTFHASEILTVAVALVGVATLAIYLKRSATGVAIRSAAENPSRAATLGIDVARVTRKVWVLAALFSGSIGIISAMSASPLGQSPLQIAGIVRILAVSVIAGLHSLPIGLAASVVFGVLDQTVLWSFGSLVVLDGVLFFGIGLVLLLQKYRAPRAGMDLASGWRTIREAKPIPVQLRGLSEVVRMKRIAIGALVLVLVGSPWILSPRQISTASSMMAFAITGLSLLVLTGWAGQISLGQFAFAAVGGWIVAFVTLPFPLDLVIGALAGAVVAVIVGLPALKMRGLHLAITSLAFSLTATTLLLNHTYLGRFVEETIDRPSIFGMDMDDERIFFYVTLAILLLTAIAVGGVRRSRAGRVLIATRDNEYAAQAFGINLLRARLGAFAFSGFIAALAGGMLALNQHGVRASAFSPETSITIFLMTVVGGLGSIAGPFLGATYLGVLELLSASSTAAFLATGGGGLFLILFVPGGLVQLLFAIRDALLRRFARRNRISVPTLTGDSGSSGWGVPIEARRGRAEVSGDYKLEGQWALHPPLEPVSGESSGG